MGNNGSRRSKRSDQKILEKMEKMNKGLYASPCPPTKAKANPKQSPKYEKRGLKAANAAQSGISQKKKKETTQQLQKTSKHKTHNRTSAEPRKGRKANYRLYVPIDDTLSGLYDAAEHEDHHYHNGRPFVPIDTELGGVVDPYGALGGGKSSYEPIDEELSELYDAFEHEDPNVDGKSYLPIDDTFAGLYDAAGYEDPHGGLYDGKSYVAIDETLSALWDIVDDEVSHSLSVQQSAKTEISSTKDPTNPRRQPNLYRQPYPRSTYRQTFPTNTRGSSYTPSMPTGNIYSGTYGNLYYYDDGCGDSG